MSTIHTTSARRQRGVFLKSNTEKLTVLPELVRCYQKAFAGHPWYEVSRCKGCTRGFSAEKVGERCKGCGTLLVTEAYPADELVASIAKKITDNPSVVYVERGMSGEVELGAIAFESNPAAIYRSAYKHAGSESTPLSKTLTKELPERTVWLDDILADLEKQPSGNLAHFEEMCEEMLETLGAPALAFRSIHMGLVEKARRVFKDRCSAITVADPGTQNGSSFLIVIEATRPVQTSFKGFFQRGQLEKAIRTRWWREVSE